MQVFICSCGAEWIKLPEINMEQILSDESLHRDKKPVESGKNNQDFVKVSIEKDTKYGNISLSKTSPFSDDFSSIFSNRKTSLFDNIFNANDKGFVTKISELEDKNDESKKKTPPSEVLGETIKNFFFNEDVQIKNETKTERFEKILENTKSDAKHEPSSILKLLDFTNVIKTIQQTIFANIPNALKGKMEYLKTIHDNILINIGKAMYIINLRYIYILTGNITGQWLS